MIRSRAFAGLLAVAMGTLPSLGAAQENPTLTIYTYDAFAADWGPGPALAEGFEATCDCTVQFVATDSSIGALRRVQLEGDSTPADIVLGLDTATIAEARDTGLFAHHGLDLAGLDMPAGFSDERFVPVDYGYFAFVYDTQALDTPPTSFEDLIALPEDFKIVIQDPRASTPGLGLVLWIKALYGDEAAAIWEGLAPHILTVAPGWSESYDLFLSGEADMVLSYTTSPVYHMVEEDETRYQAARFDAGHYAQIEIAGILASSPDQDLARDFLAYLLTPDAQHAVAMGNWMYPVVPVPDLDPAFGEMIDPNPALLLDDESVGENTRMWIGEAFAALGL